MKNNLLDDVTLEDISRQYEDEPNEISSSEKVRVHISQVYCELPKGKDIIMFALVNFNNYERYDIRRWYDNGTKPGKGMTFTAKEIRQLKEALDGFSPSKLSMEMIAEYHGGKANAKIYDRICLISSHNENNVVWNKEATIVDWNYGAKVDLRKWSEGYDKCGKGISLSFDEIEHIVSALKEVVV